MYSSIDRIDMEGEIDGKTMAVQTDHRRPDEIEATPEISVLFALARVINARHTSKANKLELAGVVYAPMLPPPAFLVDALTTVGALLENMETMERRQLVQKGDPAELTDRTFTRLAARACARLDADERDAIAALEEELSGGFEPDEENEIEYWTAVFELMALTGEVIRERLGGSWVVTDHGSVPFGFQVKDGSILLPGNRAQRSLEEGPAQGMSVLLEALDDPSKLPTRVVNTDGPIVPTLRSRAEAAAGQYVTRALFERMPPDADAPVICYGRDSETMLALIRTDSGEPEVDHAAALANLRAQKVEIEEHDVAGMTMLSVGGNFFAAEKLLDVAFMRGLEMRLRDDMIGAVVPRRGVLLVAGLGKNPLNARILSRIGAGEFEKEKSRGICPNVIILQHGAPIGMVLPGGSLPIDDEPPKKPGFFSRLFGRS